MKTNSGQWGRISSSGARRALGVGVASGVALFGGVSIAAASTAPTTHLKTHSPTAPGGSWVRPAVDGKVTAVGTNSFTVLGRSSTTYTVNVAATTTYRERGISSPTIADVKVGTYVGVAGTVSGNVVTATSVHIEASEPSRSFRKSSIRPAAAGKITAVTTNSFTIQSRSGTNYTVNVTSSTTYRERGVATPTIADVKVGEFAAVSGTLSGTTVTATNVGIEAGPLPGGPLPGRIGDLGSRPTAAGKITAVGTNTFTITNRAGTSYTVNVTGSTSYEDVGVTDATFANVKVGEFAAVSGTLSGSVVTASDVRVSATRPLHSHGGLRSFGPNSAAGAVGGAGLSA